MKVEKEHKKSALMSKTKEELTELIMMLEHNNNVLHDTLNTQADNYIKLTNWIPVSERLPNKTKDVMACSNDGVITTGYLKKSGNTVTCEISPFVTHDIIAWRLLPKPYEE